jgi:hypothetical protein
MIACVQIVKITQSYNIFIFVFQDLFCQALMHF